MTRHTRYLLVALLLLSVPAFSQKKTAIVIEEDAVVASIDGARRIVGHLAVSDDPFTGFGETYAFSYGGTSIAFVGEEEEGAYGMYVYREGNRSPRLLPGRGGVTGRTHPVWSREAELFIYSAGNRIWAFDVSLNEAWLVTEPDEPYFEDIDPAFSDDGESVLFYRGTTFEYSFAGERFIVGLFGGEVTHVPEDYPKYPSEYYGEEEYEDPYIITNELLMQARAGFFAADLENHDYQRVLTYFPGWYVIGQLEIAGYVGLPLDSEIIDNFLFNGAVMYDDYGNTIQRLDSIRRVLSHEVLFFDMEIYIRVELYDGREVGFYLLFDQDTLLFTGAFG
jgi:hypothetical protein